MKNYRFDEIVDLNGKVLDKHYIRTLSKQERESLIEPVFQLFRNIGIKYPDDIKKVDKEWKRVKDCRLDITKDEAFNNSSIGTYICKYFCKDFYKTKGEKDKKTIEELYQDDDTLRKLVANRLGLSWFEIGPEETFNLSPRMMIQGLRSMRLIAQTSVFKPDVAKYMVLRYSNKSDTIFDYSCGWGARMLGTIACDRKYIGTDPLTTNDLNVMKNHLKLDATLINSGSEDYCGNAESIDFSFSSPPYFNQEIFSSDKTQAYNKGEDYFYNYYWKKTLENVFTMLKPKKWFGLNVTNYPKMVEMAKDCFGEPVEIVKLKTTRSHLNKKGKEDAIKYEPIYMFRKQ